LGFHGLLRAAEQGNDNKYDQQNERGGTERHSADF
jgi:hypothetical protein